jgi:hypothetical protein
MPDPAHPDSHAETIYTVEMLERITQLSRERIVLYHRRGLVSSLPPGPRGELVFDETAVHRLSRMAFFISRYDLDDEAVGMLAALIDELERLREQVRFLRR